MTLSELWTPVNTMANEPELLTLDPADDAVPYPAIAAWEPRRRAKRLRQYPPVPTAFPDIAVPLRGAGTVNLVPQSAFLKSHPFAQVVTERTMSASVQFSGDSMQKLDFFRAPTRTSATPLSGLTSNGFAGVSATPRSAHAAFQHSAPPLLTAERLDRYGAHWLQSLSVTVRPLITAKRHPHIVNKFAILWGDEDAVNAYFDELLISARPDRRGFAMEVLDELVELQRAVQEQRRF